MVIPIKRVDLFYFLYFPFKIKVVPLQVYFFFKIEDAFTAPFVYSLFFLVKVVRFCFLIETLLRDCNIYSQVVLILGGGVS